MKTPLYFLTIIFLGLSVILTSCEKEAEQDQDKSTDETCCCCSSNDGAQARMALQEKGYNEVEVIPIDKADCYFEEWDKIITVPTSGLLEYYDQNNAWVASIDFGDGTCDQWITKTWDVTIFPDSPEGSLLFSLFE